MKGKFTEPGRVGVTTTVRLDLKDAMYEVDETRQELYLEIPCDIIPDHIIQDVRSLYDDKFKDMAIEELMAVGRIQALYKRVK